MNRVRPLYCPAPEATESAGQGTVRDPTEAGTGRGLAEHALADILTYRSYSLPGVNLINSISHITRPVDFFVTLL